MATYVLDSYHEIKEKETRKLLAVELSSKRDPLMEYEFSKLKMQLHKDTLLNELLSNRKVTNADEA